MSTTWLESIFFQIPTAVVAIILSGSSIALSLWVAFRTFHHYRLTARPHCQFIRVTRNDDDHHIGIYVRNNGPGIAIIESWEFFEKDLSVGINHKGFNVIVENAIKLNHEIGRMWLEPGSTLQPNATEKILWLPKQPKVEGRKSMIDVLMTMQRTDAFFEIGIVLTVKSIYDEKQKAIRLEALKSLVTG